ncbi:MAG TPA: hypothetical protein VL576_02635 [Candidatus Paceibacterota bacterium]|jgi:hypothetical protein|nr:hypothetical protein [Candidatus Paceibacterota bacterium]
MARKIWFYFGTKTVIHGIDCWVTEVRFATEQEIVTEISTNRDCEGFMVRGKNKKEDVFIQHLTSFGNKKDRPDLIEKILAKSKKSVVY